MKIVLIHTEEKARYNTSYYINAIMNIMNLKTKAEIDADVIFSGKEPVTDAVVINNFKPNTLKLTQMKKVISDDYHPNKLLFLVVQERYNSLRFLFEFIAHMAECDLKDMDIPYFVKYNELNSFIETQLMNNSSLPDVLSKFKFCLNVTNEDRLTIVLENNKYALNTVSLGIESEKDVMKDAEKEAVNYIMHCGMIDNGTYVLMEGYVPKVVRLERGVYESGSVCVIARYAYGEHKDKFCSKITVWFDRGSLARDEGYVNPNDLNFNRLKPMDEWLVENGLAEKTNKSFKCMSFDHPLMKFNLHKIPKSDAKIIMSRKLLDEKTFAIGLLDMKTGLVTEKVYSERQYEALKNELGYVD